MDILIGIWNFLPPVVWAILNNIAWAMVCLVVVSRYQDRLEDQKIAQQDPGRSGPISPEIPENSTNQG